jgi:hypothetical protein
LEFLEIGGGKKKRTATHFLPFPPHVAGSGARDMDVALGSVCYFDRGIYSFPIFSLL